MNILETIVAQKRIEVSRLPLTAPSGSELKNSLLQRGQRDFLQTLRRRKDRGMAIIAEVKKASPSAGIICPDFDPVRIARNYEEAGADCLSVLTDEKFFQGSLQFLKDIRAAVSLPLLRKDFVIDERQIGESIDWGADAILLIVAILDDRQLEQFHQRATQAGLAVLVEVHDEDELDRALKAGAELIGVNNRDLKSFKVDLMTTERLAKKLSQRHRESFLVAESGIKNRGDVERLERCGAKAILVGEHLMRSADLKAEIARLRGS